MTSSTSIDRATEAPESPVVGRLSRLQFWGILAILLLIFVFAEGAVWWHPWDMESLNGAIWYSYLPIPVLVAIGLSLNKTLGIRGWFLDVLSLTMLKYSITFSLALVLWAIVDVPVFDVAPPPAAAQMPEALPTPTPIPEAERGSMSGVVIDSATSKPVEGALVFVADGLRDYVFAPPAEPVSLENHGRGITPELTAAALNQEIRARSTDGRLHTLVATRGPDVLFNLPLIRSGAWNQAAVHDAPGEATLRCTVHQGSQAEPEASLLLLAHPFFAKTDEEGRFRFEGVPAGKLVVSAVSVVSVDRGRRETSVTVVLGRRETKELEMQLEGEGP